MSDRPALIDVFLLPGDVFVGTDRHRIRTLLGSCVSIVLWHPQRRVGAMSHFMLGDRPGEPDRRGLDGRYGEEAMQLMLAALRGWRVAAGECKGKLFGGGSMLAGPRSRAMDVGRRNGEAARRLLRSHGIEVVAESLFGDGHRQVIFEVGSGAVWARQIAPALARERVPS